MKVTKEWEVLINKIYKLIGIEGLIDLEITVPSSLFQEYKTKYQEEKNLDLSYKYIKLKAINYCTGKAISNTIKIKFGRKENISCEKKEIIIEFKYAKDIVLYLISMLQPTEVTINTLDLQDRKDSFSPPISTLDENYCQK